MIATVSTNLKSITESEIHVDLIIVILSDKFDFE